MKLHSLLKNFAKPPRGYGEVAFFWWHGDTITREKLTWILDQQEGAPIAGLQINYAHGDTGGKNWGLTLPTQPPIFSKEWWDLVGFLIAEGKKRHFAVSLSDYTLGSPGQGFYVDAVLAKHPEFTGEQLVYQDGKVRSEQVPDSINPMHNGVGDAIAQEFYGSFERRFPGECGKGINYFFSDELTFNVRGKLWSSDFAADFQAIKGYDITPKLEALFHDIGPETPKIRLDYYDVVVRKSEKAYFQPVYDFHQQRGMTFGCDHGGRGKDVTEFGDYFRTMKWNQAPGNDQPKLQSDIIKNKVSSSISHLYRRKRTWLEGFYSSNWGTTSAEVADAIFRNFAMGHNLLSLHGLYYSTGGGYWEWAPPCNHFHQPYWSEMATLLKMSERLSYLLSRGVHCCDVGIVYPVADMEADEAHGKLAVEAAFAAGRELYSHGTDFDFLDFESITRAVVKDGALHVAGESYRCVILPGMRAVRWSMLKKLAAFAERGGLVVVLDEFPSESDRKGRGDKSLDRLVERLREKAIFRHGVNDLSADLRRRFTPDFECEAEQPFVLHRKIGAADLYFVYHVPHDASCFFRASGEVLQLDPWDGERGPVSAERIERVAEGVRIRFPGEANEPALFLFVPPGDSPSSALPAEASGEVEHWDFAGEWACEIKPTLDNTFGDYRLPATSEKIGPEIRGAVCQTRIGGKEVAEWVDFDFGAQYFLAPDSMLSEVEAAALTQPGPGFERRDFSWRYGVFDDAGAQGSYHGLKGRISDEFITMGEKVITRAGSSSEYHGDGGFYFLSFLTVDRAENVPWKSGSVAPDRIYLNHRRIDGGTLPLNAGVNILLLHFPGPGRTFFVAERENDFVSSMPLSMRYFRNDAVIRFDAFPESVGAEIRFQFDSPPGMTGLILPEGMSRDGLVVRCGGREMRCREDGVFVPVTPVTRPEKIELSVIQRRGGYLGGAVPGVIKFECGVGLLEVGDWSKQDALRCYSGGILYRKVFACGEQKKPVVLELGSLRASAVVSVNGKIVRKVVAPPYRVRLTEHLVPGDNTVEILLHNTLANHLLTVPTNYRGEVSSGRA